MGGSPSTAGQRRGAQGPQMNGAGAPRGRRLIALSLGMLALGVGGAAAQEAQVVPPETVEPGPAPTPDALPDWGAPEAQAATIQDPWERLNRGSFAVHETVDKAVLGPAARGYRAVTPGFFRAGVRNFLGNLKTPVILSNDVLQGEFGRAGVTISRFGLNTTFGLAGLVDVAEPMGFAGHDEDFGQTLAVWGVGPGPYIFVPLRGPTTLRDSLGGAVDILFNPFTYLEGGDADAINTGRVALTALSARESLIEAIQGVRDTSPDPYLTIRVVYDITRAQAIANSTGDEQPPPDYGPAPSLE